MKMLNFGSLNIDYVYRVNHFVTPGETVSSENLEIICGGKGLNQSIALARAGANVWHAGNIGVSDGRILKEKISSFGVNAGYIREHDCASGHAIIQVDKTGQNCILLHGGANRKVNEPQVDEVLSGFGRGDVLILQNEINLLEYIIDKALKSQIKIALNPSPIDESIFRLPLDRIDYLFVNEIEAGAILGYEADQDAIVKISAKFPKSMIILTRGKAGAEVMYEGQRYTHGAYHVEAVDTTAAGDTFTGFFLAFHLNGKSIDGCMESASKAAAICVGRKGASQSIPSLAEVEAFEGPGIRENSD